MRTKCDKSPKNGWHLWVPTKSILLAGEETCYFCGAHLLHDPREDSK